MESSDWHGARWITGDPGIQYRQQFSVDGTREVAYARLYVAVSGSSAPSGILLTRGPLMRVPRSVRGTPINVLSRQ